jgi:hypothetical protein
MQLPGRSTAIRVWSLAAIDLLSWELMDNQTIPRDSVKASGERGMNSGSAGVEARRIAPNARSSLRGGSGRKQPQVRPSRATLSRTKQPEPALDTTPGVAWQSFRSTSASAAALLAEFNPAFAPSLSSRCPISELQVSCKILGVILKMQSRAEPAHGYRREAEKYAKLARSGQLDIANVHRTLAERYAWMAANLERRENLTHTLIVLLSKHE